MMGRICGGGGHVDGKDEILEGRLFGGDEMVLDVCTLVCC